ncbi:transcription antitermination factor NusB [Candidatus Microgenomates bacterium]|nr:transcription antitermination factor NusB [Candidatus Microgenomates bacterium]
MKTRNDPRHILRIKKMQALFSLSFHDKKANSGRKQLDDIVNHIKGIDKLIEKSAPAFPIDKVAKVDLAILRLAVYELLFIKTNPPKVVIDEAVELAKEFGSDTSGGFVNGVLGNILTKRKTYGKKSS